MKKLTTTQIIALNDIRHSKGRFFGLYTTSGEVLNAQFLGESDSYIRVFNRTNGTERKLAKTSIKSANIG